MRTLCLSSNLTFREKCWSYHVEAFNAAVSEQLLANSRVKRVAVIKCDQSVRSILTAGNLSLTSSLSTLQGTDQLDRVENLVHPWVVDCPVVWQGFSWSLEADPLNPGVINVFFLNCASVFVVSYDAMFDPSLCHMAPLRIKNQHTSAMTHGQKTGLTSARLGWLIVSWKIKQAAGVIRLGTIQPRSGKRPLECGALKQRMKVSFADLTC